MNFPIVHRLKLSTYTCKVLIHVIWHKLFNSSVSDYWSQIEYLALKHVISYNLGAYLNLK